MPGPSASFRINHGPAREGSSDRTFGLVFAGFFLVLGLVPWLKGGAPRFWALAVAGGIALVAMAFPPLLAWPNWLWTKFGRVLHRITSPLAITAIYVVAIVPTGLLMRLLGKDPLRLKSDSTAETYWIPRVPPARGDARMKNQF